jgi:tetratricopeptide (TPR) repeat protein
MFLIARSVVTLVLAASVVSCLAQSTPPANPQPLAASRAHELFLATSTQMLEDMNREKARAGYRKVVQIDDGYGPAWFNLGALAEAVGAWTEAKADFEKYLSVAPSGPYTKRAQRELDVVGQRAIQPVVTKQQRYDRAIERAEALLAAKFFKESVAEAASAQSLDDSRWEAYAIVSVCMAKEGKSKEAAEFAKLAMDRAPSGKREQIRAGLLQQISQSNKP